MSDLLQLTVAGLSQGMIIALVAFGFVAVFSVSHVINLAQGDFSAMAGLIAISVMGANLPLPLAIVVAVAVSAVVPMIMYRLTIAPVKRMNTLLSIILTLGVSLVLQATMLLIWGPEAKGLQAFPGRDLLIGGVSLRAQDLWIFGVGAIVTWGLHWFYESTIGGKALRACAEQPVAARLVGIPPVRATMVAFGIAGLVGGIAGVLTAPITFTSWHFGLTLGLKGFVAAVLGGLVSIRGVLMGALLLGVLENYVAGYVSSGLRDAVAFLVLIAVLIVRPGGLFGKPSAARV